MIESDYSVINFYKGHSVTVAETIHFNPDFKKNIDNNVLHNLSYELHAVEQRANEEYKKLKQQQENPCISC